MAIETWISFFIFTAIITSAPGPGCILTINHALQHGWKPTRMLIFGQESAVLIMMIIATTAAGVLTQWDTLMLALKIMGISWLVFSAWSAWNASYSKTPVDSIPIANRLSRYVKGFVTDITNGKAIALFVSMVPAYIDPARPMWLQAVILTATMVGTDTTVLLFYSVLCGRLGSMFKSPNFFKIQNRVSAIALLLIAGKLVTS
ncbi:MAG: LysE family translocator [Candidatus Liberibacter ctenarytainae]|uniref:LysE family translocator n=1 Tax=Candidatus Liberibacter ctenarytainae TaxID=2020335 RepID=A0A937DH74_9HYPH|nr:LysE family translocator [Candidatus Liberibacter ctenarytainae]